MNSRVPALERKYEFEYDVGLWTYGTLQVLSDRRTGALKSCKTVPKAALRGARGELPADVMPRLRRVCDLRHKHICGITEVLEDAYRIYIISDKCLGGDVAEWMVRILEQGYWLQEDTVVEYVRQVLVALAQSHAQKVCHRDLRPSSLALTTKLPDAQVLICDLGLAAVLDPQGAALQEAAASPYTAPELLAGGRQMASPEADVWSAGAIAHALLVGQPPVRCEGARTRLSDDECWGSRSALSLNFVRQLLRPAGERPTAARALQHPWLKGHVSLQAPLPHEVVTASACDAHERMLCYMLALLLLPQQLGLRDFARLKYLFEQADGDRDGFVVRSRLQRLLEDRGASAEAAAAALDLVDMRRTEVFDLCTAAVASLLAQWLPQAPQAAAATRAAELLPQLLGGFFQAYGEAGGPAASAAELRARLDTATARELAQHAGVRYWEVLAQLPEGRGVDGQALLAELAEGAGRGSPLEVGGAESLDATWRETLGIDGLGHFVHGLLQAMTAKGAGGASASGAGGGPIKSWGGA